jgi:ADP-glucose pyrophosphorylase
MSHRSQIEENRKNKIPYYEGLPPLVKQVSLDSSVGKDIEIGEKASVSKSCIGRGVKIGARTKIVNSVILNHVIIGNE